MHSPWRPRWALAALLGAAVLLALGTAALADRAGDRERALLRQLSETQRKSNQAGVASQKRIEKLSDETDELFAKYNAAVDQLAALRSYNASMREIVSGQEGELSSLRGQLEQVDAVGRSVTPLMLRMIAALESFISLDHPFLMKERTERLEELRRLMIRADVPVSEKYRLIMEAYQLEAEYGRTLEAYRAPLDPEGETVDFLRFGRVALVYLTLDESEAGVWDARTRSWQVLDGSAHDDIRTGMRIARKQIAPDLISLPLPPPMRGGESLPPQAREGESLPPQAREGESLPPPTGGGES
jgi:hypothetical protein